ncbi:hypothetical protein ACOJR9_07615 [Alteromonas sp. A081]|uniref:hypothetical protein n=1 Tax=Alteromonas sp. A081 TaxID=3410269 RepID=UPI003B987E82
MSGTTSLEPSNSAESNSGKSYVLVAWSLLLGGWLLMPIAPIIALIISYLQAEQYTLVEKSHFKKVISTFWTSFLGCVICLILYITIAGIVIALPLGFAISIYVSYRGIKGLIRASESVSYE